MAVSRTPHPLRLVLVCAALLAAGGAPAARGAYAEVAAARVTATARAPITTARRIFVERSARAQAPSRAAFAFAIVAPRPAGALYLRHCALLL